MNEAVAIIPENPHEAWELPSRGVVGILCLIFTESALFTIFVVAYIFYEGKSLSGPSPRDVLTVPVFTTVCLLSSSLTIHASVAALRKGRQNLCSLWLGATILLGAIFLAGTAREWHDLIVNRNFSIRTNLFGTTFYSLVGLHATHVLVGLFLLSFALVFSLRREMTPHHSERFNVLSFYWHFVDAVWVVVFLTVYIFGR